MPKEVYKVLVFEALKSILHRHAKHLALITDDENRYHLDTHHRMKNNNKTLSFGAVEIKKNYVSYHLMPVYVNPSLLDSISEPLKRRMQGKSCFNFRSIEPEQNDELASLTESGYQFYVEEGYI